MSDALSSLAWFYASHLPGAGESAALDAEQARHAVNILRLKIGAEIAIFDGRGQIARAVIESINPRGKSLEARVAELHMIPPPRPAIHLGAALPKGDRQATMLGMATQWGIVSFTPLACEHSVVVPRRGGGFAGRSLRVCLEACKQCRRAHAPEIHDQAMAPAELARQAVVRGWKVVLAHPCDRPLREVWPARGGGRPGAHATNASPDVLVLIGPEAGFTDDEAAEIVRAGAEMAGLGETLLRMETAAVSVIAWLRLA